MMVNPDDYMGPNGTMDVEEAVIDVRKAYLDRADDEHRERRRIQEEEFHARRAAEEEFNLRQALNANYGPELPPGLLKKITPDNGTIVVRSTTRSGNKRSFAQVQNDQRLERMSLQNS